MDISLCGYYLWNHVRGIIFRFHRCASPSHGMLKDCILRFLPPYITDQVVIGDGYVSDIGSDIITTLAPGTL